MKKRRFYSAFLWLLLSAANCLLPIFSCEAQSEVLKYAHQIIDTLASPSMHGRGYVNKGDSLAAAFIKKEFEALGVKPFGKDHYQKFELDVNTFPGNVTLSSNGKELIAGKDFIVQGSSGSLKGTFKTGYYTSTLLDSKKKKNKFKKTDFTNKVVIIDKTGFDKIKEGKQLLEVFDQNLFKAKAVIYIEEVKLTAGYSRKQEVYPKITMLKAAISSIGDSVTIDIQNKYLTHYQSQNILGYIPGSQQADSFLVFSAHYDHLGRMGDACFTGANDNASGCAMLLSLAKYYAQHPPKYSIAFMAFGAEEVGLLGSKHYVDHRIFPLKQIKFLINMDIMGTGDEGIKVVNATEHKMEFDALVKLNEEKKLLTSVQPRGKTKNSDHYFFSEAGVKAFFIYTLGGIKAYHDIYDRPETLPLTRFEESFKLLTEFSDYLQK